MRRSITTVVSLVAAFASGACEDGPSQTFMPAPTGASNVWNGTTAGQAPADSGLFVPAVTQGYDAGNTGGQNANDLCNATQEKVVWTTNFTMPIIPNPGLGAGLDLAGGPDSKYPGLAKYDPDCLSYNTCTQPTTPPAYMYDPNTVEPWSSVTLDQAQALLCQALQPASPFGSSSQQGWAGWGESDEVNIFYNLNNRVITDIFFFPGYLGNLVGTCTPANSLAGSLGGCTQDTTYTISMYNNYFMQVQNGPNATPWPNATNIELNWNTTPNTNLVSNQIYEALRQTFLPGFPADIDCVAAGHCIIDNNLTQDGILFFTPFNLAIFVENTVATTPAGTSIPIFIDVGVTKLLPFSDAQVTLKLDSTGIGPEAFASATTLGLPAGSPTTCDYKLGMKYGDPSTPGTFEHDCVQPNTPGGAANKAAQAKLIGAIAHNDEQYQFDIQGVDPQFTASLSPYAVIADGQTPGPDDVAFEFTIDQFVLGPIANDYSAGSGANVLGPKDWHGIGILTFEWAWTIHQYMAANYGVNTDLGDPYCTANLTGANGLPLRPGALGGGTGSGSGSGSSGSASGSSSGSADAGDAGGPPPAQACTTTAAKPNGVCAANESCTAPVVAGTPPVGYCVAGTTGCTCQPKVCSGLEGVTTTAPPTLVDAKHPYWVANMLGAAGTSVDNYDALNGAQTPSCTAEQVENPQMAASMGVTCVANGLAVGMKPGTWYALFCSDAGGLKNGYPSNLAGKPGYENCLGGVTNPFNSYLGYYFDTALQAVSNSYGNYPNALPGPLVVPEELASRRFYFQEWMLALVKYLQSADTPTTPLETINSNPADPNEFFFDPINPTFESANYNFVNLVNPNPMTGNPGQPPTQLSIDVNLLTSVMNNYTIDRYNFRGETLLYTALRDSASDQLGAEPLFIQNMVGSSILPLLYGTYACATNASAEGCNPGQVPPVDPTTGKSVYTPYADSFGTSAFTIPAFGGQPNDSGMTVTQVGPSGQNLELIQSAYVTVPVYTPPYSAGPGATPSGSVSALLPYLQGANIGFPVTIDGSRDKWYNTQFVDFTGETVSASAYFEYETAKNADGGTTQSTVIRAIATGSYLGLVFPCIEQSPTVAGAYDILQVRMYDNADTILNWITSHTFGSAVPVSDCGIQIKYSQYGNYADYISFGVNPGYPISGTRFNLNSGYGGSVVADVLLFDPNIVASLGQ